MPERGYKRKDAREWMLERGYKIREGRERMTERESRIDMQEYCMGAGEGIQERGCMRRNVDAPGMQDRQTAMCPDLIFAPISATIKTNCGKSRLHNEPYMAMAVYLTM